MLRLKLARLDAGLSQKRLAKMARVPQPVISLIETGKWKPTPEEIAALAQALRLPASALLEEIALGSSYAANEVRS